MPWMLAATVLVAALFCSVTAAIDCVAQDLGLQVLPCLDGEQQRDQQQQQRAATDERQDLGSQTGPRSPHQSRHALSFP